MIQRIIEWVTGKDDLERVVSKGNSEQILHYLKTRQVTIVMKPKRFLNAADFTTDQLMEQIKLDAAELDSDPFHPWVVESEGKRELLVFSSQKRAFEFAGAMSTKMDKVFGLGTGQATLESITSQLKVDQVVLNAFCKQSWVIEIQK